MSIKSHFCVKLHRLAQHASPTTTRLRKGAKIDENHNKSAHIDSCSHVNGEFVSSGFWWAFNEATYVHSVILHYFYGKLRHSQVEKWSFKLTNIVCVICDTIQTGSKHYLSLFIPNRTRFSRNKVPWSPAETPLIKPTNCLSLRLLGLTLVNNQLCCKCETNTWRRTTLTPALNRLNTPEMTLAASEC